MSCTDERLRLNPAAPKFANQGSDLIGEGDGTALMRGEEPRPRPPHGPAVAVGCPSLTRLITNSFWFSVLNLNHRWKSAARRKHLRVEMPLSQPGDTGEGTKKFANFKVYG